MCLINVSIVNILGTATCQQVLGRFINGKETLNSIEKQKDEWLEVLLKGFSKEERFQLLSSAKRLIRNNMRFAQGDA
jgi:hypothetical protein